MIRPLILIILILSFCVSLNFSDDDITTNTFTGLQAAYLRPKPLTEEAAQKFMADLKNWGVDEVFLEAQFFRVLNQSTVFPPKDPEKDWFKILTQSAADNGLKVHAWVKVGYWVYGENNIKHVPILDEHREWIDVNRRGNMVPEDGPEKHYIFVNLAIPEVRETVNAFISELCDYDIDGVSIDYIRFKSASYDPEDWFGYNEYSVRTFKEKTGLDPHNIKKDLSPGSDFMKWVKYNEIVVENCVKSIKDNIEKINREKGKNIILSASPFTGYRPGQSPKFQNWKPWDEKGYIDLWMPMCMSLDMKSLEKEIMGVKDLDLNAPYYPVVYPNQHGSLHPPLKPHHEVLMKCGIDKYAVFSYKQLKQDMDKIMNRED